ncbi:pectinesterase QRT1 [Tripterygium wilfordii]|uniref:pectinesterase n=1 Tax=Tripterygium wilfordii TaxID=458696 RepID=A0A7J7C8S0_TRIWF|nr:pectinesterase QRT1 [Tripterygium wilfordii]
MDCEYLSVVFALLLVGVQVGFTYDVKSFITWDDMKVDLPRERISTRDDGCRVIVVDKNGGGDSVTVQGAVDMVPASNTQRVKIFVLPGIYREKVLVPRSKPYISFIGEESRVADTIITWHDKASDIDINGHKLGTANSASVTIESDYFCATGITFQNTVKAVAGASEMQAAALRIYGDRVMFYKVRVLGTQDTLLDLAGTHYFYQCHIEGNVDFIAGNGKSLYQECNLHSVAESSGAIAAQQRFSPDQNTGFSFVNCQVTGTGNILLGRPWGNFSRMIYSNCYFNNIIDPQGWSDWRDPKRQKGPGADRGGRVSWSKSLSYEDAKPFLNTNFINGEQWLKL